MKLTKKQREWLRDVKERAVRDYFDRNVDEPNPHGYRMWESWRLADLCEQLSSPRKAKRAKK